MVVVLMKTFHFTGFPWLR